MTISTISLILISIYAISITVLYWHKKQKVSNLRARARRASDMRARETITALAARGSGVSDDESQTQSTKDLMMETAEQARQLHQTFQKFVPRQFVEHFARGGVDSLALGTADEDDVAVMFCDIRGFTRLSEQMSPQQLMNFLNAYFLRMNAPIHNNNGFIDKFIGDAIMALFDHPDGDDGDKSVDAIMASFELQKALKLYNYHRANSGYQPVKNGIGLHYGPVILGTVGSDDRMDTTVLGDAVNTSQRIESLTTYFGVDILASKTLVDSALKKIDFPHRLVDEVVLKGKSNKIELIEVYQHLNIEAIEQRNRTHFLIVEGIKLRNQEKFKQALEHFNEAQAKYPDDMVIKHHIATCEKLMYQVEWDGCIRL